MLGFIGLIIAIVLVIYLIYKNWHMAIVSLVGGLVVIVFNGMNASKILSENFMVSMKDFAGNWFLLFLLGAIFGKIMGDSGASVSIAYNLVKKLGHKQIVLIIMLASLILSYGGIGTFIIAFSVYPIAVALFKEADITKDLIPATILFCPTTIAMTMLPGTPSTQNLIPTKTFGTTAYAAPVMGIICSLFIAVLGYIYLNYEVKKAKASEKHFIASSKETILDFNEDTIKNLPEVWKAYIPIMLLLIVMFSLKNILESVYAVSLAMSVAIIAGCILFRKHLNIQKVICDGTSSGLGALVATASIMGFGGVVQASPAFQSCVNVLFGLPVSPVVSSVIAVNVIASITGSSAGGLNIFLNTMGQHILASQLNPQMLHRVIAIASGGLDSMPHASGVVVCNQIADTQQKSTYKHIFITCAVFPLLTCILAIILGSIGII